MAGVPETGGRSATTGGDGVGVGDQMDRRPTSSDSDATATDEEQPPADVIIAGTPRRHSRSHRPL